MISTRPLRFRIQAPFRALPVRRAPSLARATAIADLYGPGAYGTIAGVAAALTTAARAAGPFVAAIYAAAVGYSALLWTLAALALIAGALAHHAERLAQP